MSLPDFRMALRLRILSSASAAFGLIFMLLAVGALFPAVGHTIGRLNIPKGVSELLGGADYASITGWYRSEVGSIYGPLIIGAVAITGASATTAGEEEDRILALVLAHPIERWRLLVSKAAAIALLVVVTALATWVGLVGGRRRRRRRDQPRAPGGVLPSTGLLRLRDGCSGAGDRGRNGPPRAGQRSRRRGGDRRLADQRVRPAGGGDRLDEVPLPVLTTTPPATPSAAAWTSVG